MVKVGRYPFKAIPEDIRRVCRATLLDSYTWQITENNALLTEMYSVLDQIKEDKTLTYLASIGKDARKGYIHVSGNPELIKSLINTIESVRTALKTKYPEVSLSDVFSEALYRMLVSRGIQVGKSRSAEERGLERYALKVPPLDISVYLESDNTVSVDVKSPFLDLARYESRALIKSLVTVGAIWAVRHYNLIEHPYAKDVSSLLFTLYGEHEATPTNPYDTFYQIYSKYMEGSIRPEEREAVILINRIFDQAFASTVFVTFPVPSDQDIKVIVDGKVSAPYPIPYVTSIADLYALLPHSLVIIDGIVSSKYDISRKDIYITEDEGQRKSRLSIASVRYRKISLSEPFASLNDFVDVEAYGSMADMRDIPLGETVRIIGIVIPIKRKRGEDQFIKYKIISMGMVPKRDIEILRLSSADRNEVKKFIKDYDPPELFTRLRLSFAPHIIEDNMVIPMAKTALLLSAASTSIDSSPADRLRVHTLLVGPPATGKSSMARELRYLVPKYGEIHFEASPTIAGMVANVVWDEHKKMGVQAGLLPRLHGGLVVLEEVDKARPELKRPLMSVMEEGYITRTVAQNYDVRFPASVVVVALANLPYAFFFHHQDYFSRLKRALGYTEDLVEDALSFQRKLADEVLGSPALLSRFDIPMIMNPLLMDEEDLTKIQDRFLRSLLTGMPEVDPDTNIKYLSREFMAKYFTYIRSLPTPSFSEPAMEVLRDYIMDRGKAIFQSKIRIGDFRIFRAIYRISVAFARLTASPQVTLWHVNQATKFFDWILWTTFGNVLDMDNIYTKAPMKEHEANYSLKDTVVSLLLQREMSFEELYNELKSANFDVDEISLKKLLKNLENMGLVMEVKPGVYRGVVPNA